MKKDKGYQYRYSNGTYGFINVDATGKAVRYLRLYYPDSYQWGIQVTEIVVLDIDGNAATVEVEKCDKAAGVTVTTPDYNTISYNIQAVENQEGYRYLVYLENVVESRLIGIGVEAGKDYVVENLFSGYVFTAKSEKFCVINRVPLDNIKNYTEKAVRFVKITLSGGGSNYGYVVNVK